MHEPIAYPRVPNSSSVLLLFVGFVERKHGLPWRRPATSIRMWRSIVYFCLIIELDHSIGTTSNVYRPVGHISESAETGLHALTTMATYPVSGPEIIRPEYQLSAFYSDPLGDVELVSSDGVCHRFHSYHLLSARCVHLSVDQNQGYGMGDSKAVMANS